MCSYKARKNVEVLRDLLALRLQHVSSRFSFFCGVAVPMEEAAKPLIFEGFKAGCNVVLHGRRGTLLHSHVSEKCRKSFCVTGAILLQGFQNMTCIFRGTRCTLDVSIFISSWQAQHFGHVVPRVFREPQCQGCVRL